MIDGRRKKILREVLPKELSILKIMNNIISLIKFIVCFATEQDIQLTTIQLVKYIYLADLYNARHTGGETITGLPWAFIYYGPYCNEVMNTIDSAVEERIISRKAIDSRYKEGEKFYLFSCNDSQYDEIKRFIPYAVISDLKYVIKKYDADTAGLLDYVYFETEPMDDMVRKGDTLDFTKAKMPEPVPQASVKKLSQKNIQKIQECLQSLEAKFAKNKESLLKDDQESEKWKDEIYYQTLKEIDGEDLPTEIQGVAKITP